MAEMLKLSEKVYSKLKVNDVNLAWSLLCESLLKDNVNLDFDNLVAIKKLDSDSTLKPGSVLTREKEGEEKFIFQLGGIGRYSQDNVVRLGVEFWMVLWLEFLISETPGHFPAQIQQPNPFPTFFRD